MSQVQKRGKRASHNTVCDKEKLTGYRKRTIPTDVLNVLIFQ